MQIVEEIPEALESEVAAARAWLNTEQGAFGGGWIAAFALLPFGWVAISLAGWAAVVAPGILEMHRTFQNAAGRRAGGPAPGS